VHSLGTFGQGFLCKLALAAGDSGPSRCWISVSRPSKCSTDAGLVAIPPPPFEDPPQTESGHSGSLPSGTGYVCQTVCQVRAVNSSSQATQIQAGTKYYIVIFALGLAVVDSPRDTRPTDLQLLRWVKRGIDDGCCA
jgi:hypothetical protein